MLNKTPMKMLLVLSFIIFGFTADARNYYISNSGNDANSGTDPSAPWQTLNKVNLFKSFVPGDNILFNRGDTFYGSITISNSGTSGNPITFGAYGSGANPIITGFTNVTSWTNLGGNIWESTNEVSTLSYTNMVVINGANTPMGRYPNAGYLTYQSHSGFTSITSSSLTGTPNWTGAGIVIKRNRYTIRIDTVTSQSGSTITYVDNSSNTTSMNDGFGFFFQNDVRTLDTANEWYYNPSTKKIDIYSTSSPANVQIATVQNLFSVSGNRSYITVNNLSFVGANSTAVNVNFSGTGIIIQNCNISYSGLHGIYVNYSTYSIIQNNTINYSNADGIRLGGGATNPSILSNTIKSSGIFPGMMMADWSMGAISSTVDNCLVQYNNIDSSGYHGIMAGGVNMKLRNNFINHSCLIKDDGGGIYIAGSASGDSPGKEVTGNIVLNSQSDLTGTAFPNDPMGFGIYLDSYSHGVLVKGNTVSGCIAAGGLFSNNDNCTIRDNTFYNNSDYNTGFSAQSEIQIQHICCNLVRNNKFYNNIFFVKRPNKFALFFYSITDDINQFGSADSNYYTRPIDDNNVILTKAKSDVSSGIYRSLLGFQIYTGQDVHSKKSPKAISDVNDLRFVYNATKSAVTIILDANYIDVTGKVYNGSITLAPYTSSVLIKNGEISKNQPPSVNAGLDQIITLPVNSISFSGSATDVDGTPISYQWTKISGPSTYNIVNPSLAVTDVSGLVQGIYQFVLTVTDNQGAIGKDTVQVIVNTANNISPTANAGADKIITLPMNITTLSGAGSDPDGTIASYQWTKISGPSTFNIVNSLSPVTEVSGLVQGVYQFELKVTDNKGAIGKDTVQIILNAPLTTNISYPNIAPVVNAGSDTTIVAPANSVTLFGSGTDVDGSVIGYLWKQISGPSESAISSGNTATTNVSNLIEGTYAFELTVTDNAGAKAKDTVMVTVALGRYGRETNILKVYPNPTNDIAILEINTGKTNTNLMIVITDILGKTVYQNEFVSAENDVKEAINMSNLIKGTYVITVFFDGMMKQSIKVVRL